MQKIEGIRGLTANAVALARKRFGWNRVAIKEKSSFLQAIKKALREPMLLLLILASTLYFTTHAYAEGTFMLIAIATVSFISLYQESRSRNALNALKAYTQPNAKVIRDANVEVIATEEVVVGDYIIVEEGETIPADGRIKRANDFSVNESILTGESLPVAKTAEAGDVICQGTLVSSGLAICEVTAIGIQTRLAQIGKQLPKIKTEKSPLQTQMENFVRAMAILGSVVFLVTWAINYVRTLSFLGSLLKALTLAMSILPEEIPVAFATFMALGAWRLIQLGIIVKDTKVVEALGSATVICVDKTGTLTKNQMTLINVYDFSTDTIYPKSDFEKAKSVIETAMWASEPLPFDPMEQALHDAYQETHASNETRSAKMIHEYPLSGSPPIMTHVFVDAAGNRIIAAKGAPEAFLRWCDLTPKQKQVITTALDQMTGKGFRVLTVAEATHTAPALPDDQRQFKFTIKGMVAFYDPPKDNISSVLQDFYRAGIQVKLLTGDNTATALTIAKQVGFKNTDRSITGEQLISLPEAELEKIITNTDIFTRMFPEAKLSVIQTLKRQNHVVAMTGDGVNDALALKAAHIGIAMGLKGAEVAKDVSALVLSKDDLSGMVDAIATGRKIYSNLKKAIQYIISIHIPIILIVFVPLALNWPYTAIFTPVHVIFFELIMSPTCSIVYENEPIEKNIMIQKPRSFTRTFFHRHELLTSIVQGLVITTALISLYWYSVFNDFAQKQTTTMIFLALIAANIFLTLTNRSFYHSVLTTAGYKNRLIPITIGATIILTITIFSMAALRHFFNFTLPGNRDMLVCLLIGTASALWFELYKWFKRTRLLGKTLLDHFK